jgi:hypothetical protein
VSIERQPKQGDYRIRRKFMIDSIERDKNKERYRVRFERVYFLEKFSDPYHRWPWKYQYFFPTFEEAVEEWKQLQAKYAVAFNGAEDWTDPKITALFRRTLNQT